MYCPLIYTEGSALSANSHASMAFLNTQLACGAASITWMTIDILLRGVPSFDGIMNGSLAGLVAITPCAGYVDTTGAFIVGLLGGAVTSQGIKIKAYFEFDDALDAFGIHGIAGVLGVVLTGLLSSTRVSGAGPDQEGLLHGGPWSFFAKELVAIVFTIAWGCTFTAIILKLVDKLIGLRVSQSKELMGLDA
jgi:Amt family ammonium transporter